MKQYRSALLGQLTLVGVLATAAWRGLEIWAWWVPYIFGAPQQWARVYERTFAQATSILPRRDGDLPPDAVHVELQILLVAALITGGLAIARRPTDEVGVV
jgi:hypothetical protein